MAALGLSRPVVAGKRALDLRLHMGESAFMVPAQSIALLLLRIAAGGFMAYAHGLGKVRGMPGLMDTFPSMLGMGSAVSAVLATSGEFFFAGLVLVGLFTRLAAIPLAITMFVAAFIAHADDPFNKKEMALLYLILASAVALLGPGKFSIDQFLPPPLRRFGKV